MNTSFSKYSVSLLALLLLVVVSCKRDNFDELMPAEFSTTPEVFIDAFSEGLNYAAFGGSDVKAFDVDMDVFFKGTASMKFAVPDANSPEGSYAGGVFYTDDPRDLSGYDALTFWAKASKSATIDLVGFGNDLGASNFLVELPNVAVNTNWKKYIIPIPNPERLAEERGMFFYSEGPEEGLGYTFWIDEVKFEKLGTLAHPRVSIFEGQNLLTEAETGAELDVTGRTFITNQPDGTDLSVNIAPAYLDYSSSDPAIANVNAQGKILILDSGSAVITATMGELEASGSLTIAATGEPLLPPTAAPVPTVDPDSVISMFSDVYTNVPVDAWNTYWLYSTAETFDVAVDGDNMKRYRNLNFVGIEFTSQQINASEMTHFHMDIWTPDPTDLPNAFRVLLVDFGPDGTFDGGNVDDTSHELTFTSPTLQTGQWISLDMPLSSFTGLTNRTNLAQLVLSGDIPNLFLDNVYFYQSGEVTTSGPTTPAPTPTVNAADVISIFSDAYANVADTDFYPDWGQATTVSEVSVGGNNTLLYSGLNYQGTQFGANLDVSGMTHLHLDFWTSNSSDLNVFLISPGPVETPVALSVPTSGWAGIDIPLSSFSPVDLADLIQFKFDGNGDIYLDNIYFFNDMGGGPTMPTVPAPVPAYAPGDVISIFSDSYSNVADTDFYPNWGQATVVSEMLIDGNNTLVYTGLNYQGVQLATNQDVSGMTYLHLDFWTANSGLLNVFLISPGPVETPYQLTVPTSGWSSVDIPLTEFSPVVLSDLHQFKFEGTGDIYLDNILFRN